MDGRGIRRLTLLDGMVLILGTALGLGICRIGAQSLHTLARKRPRIWSVERGDCHQPSAAID
jgi:hypothetical protein